MPIEIKKEAIKLPSFLFFVIAAKQLAIWSDGR